MGLSGYMLAAVWGGGSTNYSYPLYYDMGAAVQDHFLNWKVTSNMYIPCHIFCSVSAQYDLLHLLGAHHRTTTSTSA